MLTQIASTMPPKRRKAVKDEEPSTSIALNITALACQLEALSEPLTHNDILSLHQLLKVNNLSL